MGALGLALDALALFLALVLFLAIGYHVGYARGAQTDAYDAEIDDEAPGAGDLTEVIPEVPTSLLGDAGDGQELTSDPAIGGASAAAVTLTRAAAASGGAGGSVWGVSGAFTEISGGPSGTGRTLTEPGGGGFGRALRAALDAPEVGTAIGRPLLIALRKAEMSTEIFRSGLVHVSRYAGPDLGPAYPRGRVQITLSGHTDAGLPRQIGMTYAHWAQLAAAVASIGPEPDRAEAVRDAD